MTCVDGEHVPAGQRLESCHRFVARSEAQGVNQIIPAQELGHKNIRRIVIKLARRTNLLDLPLIHYRDAITESKSFFLIVGYIDGRQAQSLDQRVQLATRVFAQRHVQGRKWFMEQEQGRCDGDGACYSYAVLM